MVLQVPEAELVASFPALRERPRRAAAVGGALEGGAPGESGRIRGRHARPPRGRGYRALATCAARATATGPSQRVPAAG